MATIYQKLVTGGMYDQCLILDQFEGIQYKLPNEVKDWNEIRIGLMLSITTHDDNNAQPPKLNSISSLTFTPENSPWIGLKTNNQSLPCKDNTAFIGIGYPASSFSLNSSDDLNRYWYNFRVDSTDSLVFMMGSGVYPNSSYKYSLSYSRSSTAPCAQGLIPWISGVAGTSPASLFCMRFTRTSGGNAINWNYSRNGNENDMYIPMTSTADTSIHNLRQYMSTFGSQFAEYAILSKVPSSQQYHADPFTSDGTMSGVGIPNPDSFFIYWPFPNNRLRIHNFCVEKYA